MPIKTTCPGCGLTCTAPDHLHGKTIQCKRCATSFAIGSRAQLHEEGEDRAAPLIPPPRDGNPLPPAAWHQRMKHELLGAGILGLIALAAWGIYKLFK